MAEKQEPLEQAESTHLFTLNPGQPPVKYFVRNRILGDPGTMGAEKRLLVAFPMETGTYPILCGGSAADPGSWLDSTGLHYPLVDIAPVSEKGVKWSIGKIQYWLFPRGVLREVVEILTQGAKEYGPNNWMKVEPKQYVDALWRHLEDRCDGEVRDKKSGKLHWAHIICNAAFLAWMDLRKEGKVPEHNEPQL